MSGVTVAGALDPVLGWDREQAYVTEHVAAGVPPAARLEGAAAGVEPRDGGGVRVFRDGLGLGKLFWVRDRDDAIVVAARPIDLVQAGHDFDDITAFPRGHIVAFDSHGHVTSDQTMVSAAAPQPVRASLAETGARIRR